MRRGLFMVSCRAALLDFAQGRLCRSACSGTKAGDQTNYLPDTVGMLSASGRTGVSRPTQPIHDTAGKLLVRLFPCSALARGDGSDGDLPTLIHPAHRRICGLR